MPLDTPLEPVAPVKPVSSRVAQRAPQRQDAGSHGSFADMLRGQGAKSLKAAPDTDQAPTTDSAPKADRKSDADQAEASGDTEAADKGDAKDETADAPKKTALSAEDLPAQPSTLQLVAKREDLGGASRGLDALKGRGHAGGAGARRAGELKDAGGIAATGDAATADGFRSSLLAARQASGDSPADAASMSLAAAPVAERASERESDGSLPSLAGMADLAASRPATDASAELQAAPAQAQLPTPPDSPLFPQALGVQLSTWMDEGVSHAKLELNPADLGPIEVRIAVHEGSTRIELNADVASTRSALSEALPQLAEQLGDVGLSLAGGSVSDQTSQGQRQGDSGAQQAGGGRAFGMGGRGNSGDEALDNATMSPARTAVNRRGLLDMYA
ncbi:flagellar hook-length control protein FliK [Ideonella azotifigens]|uniref:Flagellar hook-length control protein FliK n=3 Tax=Ideonella azotifigens TaxID=513160 RepID=A0ABN1K741_9BURK|nr:flagellar hook-length control protein FliK [Ideonella azotifigens]MCD2342225.1 flagellar hook-length control protein FliK [Ideonella azotifigens]